MIRFIIILFISSFGYSQLHHSTLSIQSNNFDSNNAKVLYTVGQINPIGNFISYKSNIFQGFHQPLLKSTIKKNIIEYNILTYPNPFKSNINFEFKNISPSNIQIMIYDSNGRYIKSLYGISVQDVLSLNLVELSTAEYVVRLIGENLDYTTKIIKE